jgi:hypothetical protein
MLADMRLKDPRIPLTEAAKSLGYAHTTLYVWIRRPEYIRYENWLISRDWQPLPPGERAERQASMTRVKERFEAHAEEMQDRLLAILDTVDDPKLQAQVAQDWLDRSGAAAQKTAPARGLTLVADERLLKRFLDRAVEAELVVEGEVGG